MRFKIDFKLLGEAPFSIPVNYQSEFSAWIHKMIHFQSNDFKNWLTKNKFLNAQGEYKLFTFSDVFFAPHKLQKDKLIVEDENAWLILSFYAPDEIETFVLSIFRDQEFKLGDSQAKIPIKITNVEKITQPDFGKNSRTVFTCLSPMLIAEPGKNPETYFTPDQKDFEKVFFKSLMYKYANLVKYMTSNPGNGLSDLDNLQFKLFGKPRTKIIKVKTDTLHQKTVKGYLFDFEVKAPDELLKIGLNAGFGELNHLGFGCCEIKG